MCETVRLRGWEVELKQRGTKVQFEVEGKMREMEPGRGGNRVGWRLREGELSAG